MRTFVMAGMFAVLLTCTLLSINSAAYEYYNNSIHENFPDSVREPDALLFGGKGLEYGPGTTYKYLTIPNIDIRTLFLSASRSIIIDSVRLWNGQILNDIKGVILIEDSALINYLLSIGATALTRRLPNTSPGTIDMVVDFSGSEPFDYLDLSEHYRVEFPDTLDVDQVKADLEAILSPECYVQYAPIPIDFDIIDPQPAYNCDSTKFNDYYTKEQWYLRPRDSTKVGVDFFGAWEGVCPYLYNRSTAIAIIDSDFGSYPDFHPDFNCNIDFEKSRVRVYESGCHGVCVTGVLGAAAGNNPAVGNADKIAITGIGIVGGSFRSDLVLLTYFNAFGELDYISCFKYIIDSCPEVKVINCSWGIFYIDPALLEVMLAGYCNNNLNYVASAGNCSIAHQRPFPVWPAAFGQSENDNLVGFKDFVTAVSHSNIAGQPRSETNSGDIIDIASPGYDIFTTGPFTKYTPTEAEEKGYSIRHGSSLSAPMVSAGYALMRIMRPDISSSTLYEIMMETAYLPDDSLIPYFNNGVMDAKAAVVSMENIYCNTIYGDIDGDCHVNGGDVIFMQNWLFKNGPKPWVPDKMLDVNGDCSIDVLDVMYLIKYVWHEGPAPLEGCVKVLQVDKKPIYLRNYPNPFNPSTTIEFELHKALDWTISIFNILGQKVKEFIGRSEKGLVRQEWDGKDKSGAQTGSGVYFYQLTAGDIRSTKKMIIIK